MNLNTVPILILYWFRAFALGVLDVGEVKKWEAKLFGGINPHFSVIHPH
jgi:hypothetical protein